MTKALDDIAAERERQKTVEGWTEAYDDQHATGDMAKAAACYALNAGRAPQYSDNGYIRSYWPWDWKWWKPKDRRRDLVRAGALIVAEIERLDRLAEKRAKAA